MILLVDNLDVTAWMDEDVWENLNPNKGNNEEEVNIPEDEEDISSIPSKENPDKFKLGEKLDDKSKREITKEEVKGEEKGQDE